MRKPVLCFLSHNLTPHFTTYYKAEWFLLVRNFVNKWQKIITLIPALTDFLLPREGK